MVAVAVLAPAAASGQGLAEAARRAEEARKARTSSGIVFDEGDLNPVVARQELDAFAIDASRWTRFLAADRAVGRILETDSAALQRLQGMASTNIRALERFIRREPAVEAAVRAAGTEPREFAYTRLAVGLAVEANKSPETMALRPPAVHANATFVRSRDREVMALAVPAPKLPEAAPRPAPRPSLEAPADVRPGPAFLRPEAPRTASSSRAAADPGGTIEMRVGTEVPDFAFTDFNGGSRRLSDFRGRYVLLDFWGSWCGPCRSEVPHAKAAYAQFRSRNFEILGLDYERGASVEQVRDYLRKGGVDWTFATADSVRDLIVDRFGVYSFPTLILIDPDAKIVESRTNALRGANLARTLDRVLPK